ncbi:PREDICTED: inactive protein RESTRICTED TEV MOVEMENT 2-like isoform X2 [Populus euphratica]|uniref:Inactive protein RESTRICTED TEV MOVEMENT 2-like isoform X2 n=1 Tax=Populus euphratica TaxID=75702 RepID=A0AAJ6UN30_POPEU|nr:PREDICTED: inactive protein RESTRICTED TEV MOVEMENT 2-like isoform X2 [Populus euphratica]
MMNPRGGYTGFRPRAYNPPRRLPLRSTSQSLTTNFQPNTEWKEEDAALVLLVYLPGFLKEQVIVTADELQSTIRVYGERVLANNMRSRFNTAHTVPKNCDLSQTKLDFAGGILIIRIPKNIPAVKSTDTGELEATASQEDPGLQDSTGKPKPEKNGEETPSGRTSTTFSKETEGKDVKALSPQKAAREEVSQKGQDEAPRKADLLVNTTKQIEEKSTGLDGEKAHQIVTEKKEKNEANGKRVEEEKEEKVAEKPWKEEEKGEEPKIAEKVVEKPLVKEEEEESVVLKKDEEEENATAAGDDKEKSNKDISKDAENARASANKDEDMKNDENQLIVNIFVAVSIIMAVGAHFYSIFSSSGKI